MGYYINPEHCTKEGWLDTYGESVYPPDDLRWPPPSGKVFVCLIKNPTFTAAGVAYCEEEFKQFLPLASGPWPQTDHRLRKWYTVPRAHIIAVCPEVEGVLV
ncbi:hypothetical protein LCGC14_2788060 [marine sediment metagenome]|uniref:Uncharacterized protein n=1 Tax=marine sediment metagenome TaxID=412755 RepID=A0A0F9BHW1_9ZZZZ